MGDAGYNLTLVLARLFACVGRGRNIAVDRLGDGGIICLFPRWKMNDIIVIRTTDKHLPGRKDEFAVTFGLAFCKATTVRRSVNPKERSNTMGISITELSIIGTDFTVDVRSRSGFTGS